MSPNSSTTTKKPLALVLLLMKLSGDNVSNFSTSKLFALVANYSISCLISRIAAMTFEMLQGPGFEYVSGRKRPSGEINGKSGNLNNVFRQIYKENVPIPGNEVLAVFDADQVT